MTHSESLREAAMPRVMGSVVVTAWFLWPFTGVSLTLSERRQLRAL